MSTKPMEQTDRSPCQSVRRAFPLQKVGLGGPNHLGTKRPRWGSGVGFYPREFADLGMAFLLTRGGSGYAAKQIWLMANQQTLAMA